MVEQSNKWPKQISVDKRIVRILSQQTYDSFPTAIKEIITNSYDADATEVKITVDEKKEQITIEDNGKGMSETEFEFFLRIAGKKRDKGTKTKSGRFIIGQFGVGFLSSFPFFKNYEIRTTKKGELGVVEASIPCYKYFKNDRVIDIGDIKIAGIVKDSFEEKARSYTTITLRGFTDLTRKFFEKDEDQQKLRYSINSSSGIDKLKWSLSEDLPIKYEDVRFNKMVRIYSPNIPFKVLFNKKELLRKTYGQTILEVNGDELKFDKGSQSYENKELDIVDDKVKHFGNISIQYFILTNRDSVRPYEARGFKRRNLDAGVGRRELFGLGTEYGGARSRVHQLTGEIHVIKGLNDIINVSRDDFGYSEDWENVKEFLRKKLRLHSDNLQKESDYKKQQESTEIKRVWHLPTVQEQEIVENESESKNTASSIKSNPVSIPQRPEKVIEIGDREYNALSSDWDYKNEFFPACKIENDNIIINQSYPLFQGVKHTDVFLKMHLLLLKNLNEGVFSDSNYSKIVDEILDIYKDYI